MRSPALAVGGVTPPPPRPRHGARLVHGAALAERPQVLRRPRLPSGALPAPRRDGTGGDGGERAGVAGRPRQGAGPVHAGRRRPRLLGQSPRQAPLPLHHPARHGRARAAPAGCGDRVRRVGTRQSPGSRSMTRTTATPAPVFERRSVVPLGVAQREPFLATNSSSPSLTRSSPSTIRHTASFAAMSAGVLAPGWKTRSVIQTIL